MPPRAAQSTPTRGVDAASYRAFFEGSLSGAILMRPHTVDGVVTDMFIERVNDAACEILRLDRASWEGQLHSVAFPTDRGQETTRAYIRVFETGEALRTEFHYKDDRVEGWYDISAVRIDEGVAVTFLDVTDRVRASNDMNEQRRQLELFIRHTPAAVAILDDQMRYVCASDRWCSDYQLAGQSIIGRSHYDVFPDIPDRWKVIHARCLAGQVLSVDEDPFDRDDGTTAWVKWAVRPWTRGDGTIGGIVMFTEVITDRKNAELALRQSEQRLALALESARRGLWDWHVPSGAALMDDRFADLVGYAPGELTQGIESWKALLHPDDVGPAFDAIARHFQGETAEYCHQFRMRHKDLGYTWFESVGRVVERGADGSPIRMIGIIADITEQRASNDALEAARLAADAANRAKTEFLANMSHEIRTPMTAILGYAELIAEDSLTPDARAEHVRTIMRNGTHLLDVINDILDFSKIEAGKMDAEHITCSPRELAENVVSLMTHRAEQKGLDLRLNLAPDLPASITSDPTRVRQILVNLVGNAIKFTEQGGVSLSVAYDDQAAGRPTLCFDVTDTGIGVPPDRVPTLFSAFSQTDASYSRRFGGTGLGLTISARLATLLGGSVELVRTEVGRGSTFRLTIDPGVVGMASALPEHPERRTPDRDDVELPTLSGRILLAEDGPDNQRLLAHHLRKAGADVTVVDNGLHARDHALEHHQAGTPFDLIFMDMQMPVMDGLTATEHLRASGYAGAIVALTAHAMDMERSRCLAKGCDEHLAKPIAKRDLVFAAHRWITRVRRASA